MNIKQIRFVPLFLIYLAAVLHGCSLGLDKELDFEPAESVIEKFNDTGIVDSTLLEESGAHSFVENKGYYLFVVNAFKHNFNGWVYTKKPTDSLSNISFES